MKEARAELLRATLLLFLFLCPSTSWSVPSLAERCGAPQKAAWPPEAAAGFARTRGPKVDRLLGVATRSYLQGQWNSALDALDAAAELIPSADILFNRAQTCREAGEERAALSLYEQAAQQASDATLKTAASKRASELRARLSVKAGLAALSEQEQRLARQQELIQKVQRELAATKVAPPLHKRWWLWTAVGGAVAAVVVVSAVTAYELPRQPIYPNFQVVMLR